MKKWTYFTDKEVEGLDTELVAKLDQARHIAGVPFQITSGYRSMESNAAAQGVGDSSHLNGLAVDLACSDSHNRFRMLLGALQAGFKRVGVYNHHIHLDIDDSKVQEVTWTGVST